MNGDLHTTNVLLGIMAAVSALEGLLLVGAIAAVFVIYRRASEVADRMAKTADDIRQQIPPVLARVNAILDDVKSVAAVVKEDTAWADRSVRSTVDKIDNIRTTVRDKTHWVTTAFRGLRFALTALGR